MNYKKLLNFQKNQGAHNVLSHFEFWPAWLFYLPVYIYALCLAIRYRSITLPTVANPFLADGAFCGDSKNAILNLIKMHLPEYSVKHICLFKAEIGEIETRLQNAGIGYPFVAKPDLGCRGVGVNLISDKRALEEYLGKFPKGERLICQELIPYESEVGVFYCKLPTQSEGRIISLTVKDFPSVYGDGKSTLKQLIDRDPRAGKLVNIYYPRHRAQLNLVPPTGEKIPLVFSGNHCRGTIFKSGNHLISKDLEKTFEAISSRLPEFYFGRFDIRYENFQQLEKGVNFKIVEINGASSESTHIWDANYSLLGAYKDLFWQFRALFVISERNRKRGFTPQPFAQFYKAYLRDKKLASLYPDTH